MLYTLKEAAGMLGLSPSTLKVQAAKGVLKAAKRGRDLWVTGREIERYRRVHKGAVGPKPKKRRTK